MMLRLASYGKWGLYSSELASVEGEADFVSDCTVGLAPSLLSRVVREHDDGAWNGGRRHDLQEHGMM
jgi:hypothetical protein